MESASAARLPSSSIPAARWTPRSRASDCSATTWSPHRRSPAARITMALEHVVVRTIIRADATVVARLAAVGGAAAHEAQGRRVLLDPAVRPVQTGVRVAGPAVTVLCQPGDNLMIHLAVEHCQP